MPCSKEAILKQTTECRQRVKLLLDLKKDVSCCIEDVCYRLTEQLPMMEAAAETASMSQLRKMTQTLRNARRLLKDYEDGLERVRLFYEDEDLDFCFDETASGFAPSLVPLTNGSNPAAVGALVEAETAETMPRRETTNGSAYRPPETPEVAYADRPNGAGMDSSLTSSMSSTQEVVPIDIGSHGRLATAVQSRGQTPVVVDQSGGGHIQSSQPTEPVSLTTRPSHGQQHRPSLAPSASPVVAHEPTEPQQAIGTSLPARNSEEIHEPQVAAAATASANADYRMHIVSKGNGKDECCQESVDLFSASQHTPIPCALSHAESPSFFWLQLFNSAAADINDELNGILETEQKALSNPKVGDYCAAPVEGSDDMQRAKILEIKDNHLGTSFSKILYLDTGKVDWVATKALLELPQRSRHYLRQACPCILAEIEPAGGVWTPELVDAFRQLCASDEQTQLCVATMNENGSSAINTVRLFRAKKDDTSKMDTVLIAFIKMARGKILRAERALPAKAFEKEDGGPIGGADPPDVTEGWRCTVRVLETERNNVEEPDVDDRAEDNTRTVMREALQAAMGARAARAANTLTPGEVWQRPLQECLDGGYAYLHILEAVSPTNFYVQFRDSNGRNDALDALAREMNTFYSNPVNQKLLSHPRGQSAVARSTRDGETAYRRIVIKDWRSPTSGSVDIRVHSVVSAVFVDYGYCAKLQSKDVFVLDESFCRIPAQSAFCKLYECYPTAGSTTWDQNSVDIFKRLTMEGKPLIQALVFSDKQPYELVMSRKESDGTWTCINQKMVESNLARSDVGFFQ